MVFGCKVSLGIKKLVRSLRGISSDQVGSKLLQVKSNEREALFILNLPNSTMSYLQKAV